MRPFFGMCQKTRFDMWGAMKKSLDHSKILFYLKYVFFFGNHERFGTNMVTDILHFLSQILVSVVKTKRFMSITSLTFTILHSIIKKFFIQM